MSGVVRLGEKRPEQAASPQVPVRPPSSQDRRPLRCVAWAPCSDRLFSARITYANDRQEHLHRIGVDDVVR